MARILFIGDIVGRPGRQWVKSRLASLCDEKAIDIVVANAENSAAGAGINLRIAHELHAAGVDAITLGDHVWDQRGFDADIQTLDKLCRPANLPEQCPGKTYIIVEKNDFRLGVFTVLGSTFMKIDSARSAFLEADDLLKELAEKTDAILIEFHGETTSEKIAFGWYMDGRVAAVLGTHTHIPTADERVLPAGTAYQTDVGMSGPYESVLGRKIEPIIGRFLDGMPRRFDVAENDVRLCGAIIDIDEKSGLARSIERLADFKPET